MAEKVTDPWVARSDLDALDRRILDALSHNARITVTDLAAAVGLSKTPCAARIRRLESEGYILGYRAQLDPVKLGLENVAFVEVKLRDTTERALKEFNAAVARLPEVEQCHMIAGGFDYLVKIRTRDITAYRRFLGEQLSALPHVAQTSTYMAMESVKDAAMTA
ncbi:Lrp/AsnC family transcriptional regulator [Pseudooceanicola nanhaiensis]|uniref:Lrp/AsnC family transcriptional regulator n=1 Tax=Pseudooceanicola nanhaiensis TaxID=375761 RepID=UPI001CD3193D|nr:Lrp/AsnC ligand binding domain-containing protein [Pseudooceanicola nanhaiensis]MCA0922245.1 Lrp/AsnC ligand binding domain-containing protein [Pseudooceanicola nanhaiensis]